MREGAKFPKIVLCTLERVPNVLLDGRHRLEAYKENNDERVEFEYAGAFTKQEGLVQAINRNIKHGIPFTEDERLKAYKRLVDAGVPIRRAATIVQMRPLQISRPISSTFTRTIPASHSPMMSFPSLPHDHLGRHSSRSHPIRLDYSDDPLPLEKRSRRISPPAAKMCAHGKGEEEFCPQCETPDDTPQCLLGGTIVESGPSRIIVAKDGKKYLIVPQFDEGRLIIDIQELSAIQ